jgi:very-short-patch-repair endonuclease
VRALLPHPSRPSAEPPSPTRGEGSAFVAGVEQPAEPHDSVAVGEGAVPSPLVGEGGTARSAVTDEVTKRTTRSVTWRTKRARGLRRVSTDAERKLWKHLRQPPLSAVKFRRQVPMGPYVADFLSYSARIVVEADGGQHAESDRDRARDPWFRQRGWRVLRFWNTDILKNMDGVLTTIMLALPFRQQTEGHDQ